LEYEERRRIRVPSIRIRGLSVVAIVLVAVIAVALFLSIGRVNVGYVAVIVDPLGGTISSAGDGSSSRYFFKAPWATTTQIYVATESVQMWTDIDPATGQAIYGDLPAAPSLTQDGLGVEVDVTVRWTLSPSLIADLYKKYPAGDWEERAIVPIIREAIRDTLVEFTAIRTIEDRQAVAASLEIELREQLRLEPSLVNATILGTIDLREIALPQTFIDSIEAKLAAEQLAIAAEFNATKILVIANANKNATIIEAQGAAEATILAADATFEAIQQIAGESIDPTQLTFLYLYLKSIESAAAEEGTMIIVVGPNQTVPFIVSP
jgi:regulator of protease activity HflC (stomatin/prohibitin superfamily)